MVTGSILYLIKIDIFLDVLERGFLTTICRLVSVQSVEWQ